MRTEKIKNKDSIMDDFDDDFEVTYEGELPKISIDSEDDDYKDVLSSLSELDNDESVDYIDDNYRGSCSNDTRHTSYEDDYDDDYDYSAYGDSKIAKGSWEVNHSRKSKWSKTPDFISPLSKTAKSSAKIAGEILSFLFRTITLILIAIITAILAWSFWDNYSTYGNIITAITDHNYVLGAYFGTALFLLFVECLTFLAVLFGSKRKRKHLSRRVDTGRGLFSFIFIYLCSLLSYNFGNLIPSSSLLLGFKGALSVCGELNHTLLGLCTLGIISCLVRKFIIR